MAEAQPAMPLLTLQSDSLPAFTSYNHKTLGFCGVFLIHCFPLNWLSTERNLWIPP